MLRMPVEDGFPLPTDTIRMTAPTPTTTPVKLRASAGLCAARIWQESTAFGRDAPGWSAQPGLAGGAVRRELLSIGFGVTGLDDGLILRRTRTDLQHDEPAQRVRPRHGRA